jgi:hypothetical protein
VTDPGTLYVAGHNWMISRALAGEWVQLVRIEQRILVYYCHTLIRELDFSFSAAHARAGV